MCWNHPSLQAHLVLDKTIDTAALKGPPSTKQGLTGLAFSGGGIRSATISLGVVQALANRKHKIFKSVDYMSTVSGGGFVGSCITSLLNDPNCAYDGENNFPLRHETGVEETSAVHHLRNSGNYLAPGGTADTLRIPAILVRGIIVNFLSVLPWIMILVLMTEVLYETLHDLNIIHQLVIVFILGLFGLSIIIFPFVAKIGRGAKWARRNWYEGVFTLSFTLVCALVVFVPASWLVGRAIEANRVDIGLSLHQLLHDPIAAVVGNAGSASAVAVALILLVVLLSRASSKSSPLAGKVTLLLISALGPITIFGVYLLLCVIQVDSHDITRSVGMHEQFLLSDKVGEDGKFEEALPEALVQKFDERGIRWDKQTPPNWGEDGHAEWRVEYTGGAFPQVCQVRAELTNPSSAMRSFEWTYGCGGIRPEPTIELTKFSETIPTFALQISAIENLNSGNLSEDLHADLNDPVSETPLKRPANVRRGGVDFSWNLGIPDRHGWVVWLGLTDWFTEPCSVSLLSTADEYAGTAGGSMLKIASSCYLLWDELDDVVFILLTFTLLAFMVMVDVNRSSVHPFYRDRLSNAYLIHSGMDGVAEQADAQKLSMLYEGEKRQKAPYHLINVTLNLQGSDYRDLRGRRADFFFFSKCYTGGRRTGYCKTSELEKADSHVDLGTAMAISGAAAAPNMGTTTVPALVFVMTLLNVRLGYWLPNPAKLASSRFNSLLTAWAWYLVREAFGATNEKTRYVNVSDGGHLENLALYELLRRRCERIIVVDGEADPEMRFGGLMQVLRFARIDMGIEIELDLEKLRKDANGLSSAHGAVGKIHYGGGEEGQLVYLKSSFTGSEGNEICDYRDRNKAFPHESTGDQFFDEAQFEAYRAIGHHIGEVAFKNGWPSDGWPEETKPASVAAGA